MTIDVYVSWTINLCFITYILMGYILYFLKIVGSLIIIHHLNLDDASKHHFASSIHKHHENWTIQIYYREGNVFIVLHFLVDFHLLQNKNCDSNLRPVVDEAFNCKLLTVYISLFKYFNIHGVSKHHFHALQKFELKISKELFKHTAFFSIYHTFED